MASESARRLPQRPSAAADIHNRLAVAFAAGRVVEYAVRHRAGVRAGQLESDTDAFDLVD